MAEKQKTSLIKYLLMLFASVLIGTLIICIITVFLNQDKSTYRGLLLVYNIQFVVALSLSSATIFLNLIKKVRNTGILNFLSFYLLPLLLLFVEISPIATNASKIKTMSIIVIPFFVLLTIAFILYINFKKQVKQ